MAPHAKDGDGIQSGLADGAMKSYSWRPRSLSIRAPVGVPLMAVALAIVSMTATAVIIAVFAIAAVVVATAALAISAIRLNDAGREP
jgi:hypothetical protein